MYFIGNFTGSSLVTAASTEDARVLHAIAGRARSQRSLRPNLAICTIYACLFPGGHSHTSHSVKLPPAGTAVRDRACSSSEGGTTINRPDTIGSVAVASIFLLFTYNLQSSRNQDGHLVSLEVEREIRSSV